jgi:hypothetical protein
VIREIAMFCTVLPEAAAALARTLVPFKIAAGDPFPWHSVDEGGPIGSRWW